MPLEIPNSLEGIEQGGAVIEKNKEKRLVKGDTVRVKRTSGEVEDGWILEGYDISTGDAIVRRLDKSGKTLEKKLPQGELYDLNMPIKSFSEWHRKWVAAGGDPMQQFDAKHFTSEKIDAEKASSILSQGRVRLLDNQTLNNIKNVFEPYLKNKK